jgi:preprotein translocase subunit SecF
MYDRLREIRARRTQTDLTLAQQVNLAVNQTLSRTVLTVATVADRRRASHTSAHGSLVTGERALRDHAVSSLQ